MADSDDLLTKIEHSVPSALKEFDAFPKLPASYKARSGSRGLLTVVVGLATFFLLLNDIADFMFGWPHYEFAVDHAAGSAMKVNVDMVVNMPCGFLSVDLRDAVGDRLYLTSAFRRDGTTFDVGSAVKLQEHAEQQASVQDVVSRSKKARGFFSFWTSRQPTFVKPKLAHEPSANACKIYGTLVVKKVTANLHITTLGHGYQTMTHVDHTQMNLSHVITEFSFGEWFPEIVQPLDNSFELTTEHFMSYQYFMHIVPTTYIAPRSRPVETNQYSVTHYTRVLDHNRGTPGIFFKFDVDPLKIILEQRTLGFISFIIRCVGVIGGVFTCMSYSLRVGAKAVEIVAGPPEGGEIASVGQSSGVARKWRGGELHARSSSGRVVRQGNSWVVEGSEAQYGGSRAGTPTSPYMHTGSASGSPYGSPVPGSGFGGQSAPPRSGSASPSRANLGLSPSFGPAPAGSAPASPLPGAGFGSAPPTPGAGYAYFPPTPSANAQGFPSHPLPGSPHPVAAGGFGQRVPPPPPSGRSVSGSSAGSLSGPQRKLKDD